MTRFRQLALGAAGLILSWGAGTAGQATTFSTITFDRLYNGIAGRCIPIGSQDGINYTNTENLCGRPGYAYLESGLTEFPGLVLEAGPTVESFDLLGLEILASFPELFAVAKSAVPAGIDPTTPEGYEYIWINDLWELVNEENLSIRGYLDGVLVAEESYFIPDNCGVGGCPPAILPNSDAPLGGVFTGIDRLEIASLPGFGVAADLRAQEGPDSWYTCVGPCGYIIVDNAALAITPADIIIPPDPPVAPVPLPAGALLGLSALGALAGLRLRGRRTRG